MIDLLTEIKLVYVIKPTKLYQSEPIWAKLFTAFVAACTQRMTLQVEELNKTLRVDDYAA